MLLPCSAPHRNSPPALRRKLPKEPRVGQGSRRGGRAVAWLCGPRAHALRGQPATFIPDPSLPASSGRLPPSVLFFLESPDSHSPPGASLLASIWFQSVLWSETVIRTRAPLAPALTSDPTRCRRWHRNPHLQWPHPRSRSGAPVPSPSRRTLWPPPRPKRGPNAACPCFWGAGGTDVCLCSFAEALSSPPTLVRTLGLVCGPPHAPRNLTPGSPTAPSSTSAWKVPEGKRAVLPSHLSTLPLSDSSTT